MELLEQRIAEQGKVIGSDIIKVDMFLNHQIDVGLLCEIGKEFRRLFAASNINKIVTIEASGIGIACITAQYFSVPVVFAKKGAHRNVGNNLYTAEVHSFTKGVTTTIGISKDYLNEGDRVLIIDDFMAYGNAALGLIDLVEQGGASIAGFGFIIEKSFQGGGDMLRSRGYRVESLAEVLSLDNCSITLK